MALGGSIESETGPDDRKTVVDASSLRRMTREQATDFVRVACVSSNGIGLPELSALIRRIRTLPEQVVPIVTTGTDTLEEVGFICHLLAPTQGVIVAGTLLDGATSNVRGLLVGARRLSEHMQVAGVAAILVDGQRHCGCSFSEEQLFFGSHFRRTSQAPKMTRRGGNARPGALLSQSTRGDLSAKGLSIWPTLAVIPSAVSATPGLALSALREADVAVVQGFGPGDLRPELASHVEDRLSLGRPVVLVGSHPAIGVRAISSAAGGGARLLEKGAWNAGKLSVRKAALLAALVFARDGADVAAMRSRFEGMASMVGSHCAHQ